MKKNKSNYRTNRSPEFLGTLQRLHDRNCGEKSNCIHKPYNQKKCEGCGIRDIFVNNKFKPEVK